MSSCDTLLNAYFSWANQQDLSNGKALVDCTLVVSASNKPPNQPGNSVILATGVLEFSPAKSGVDFITQPAQLSGELDQDFPDDSDITETFNVTISGGRGPVVHLSPPSVSITVTRSTYPPSQDDVQFEPQCLAGAIYGTDPQQNVLFVISLGGQHFEANAGDPKM